MSPPLASGVLPVEKGPGVTSFQVVAYLRRLLGAPKIGHGGTLDPEAMPEDMGGPKGHRTKRPPLAIASLTSRARALR